MLQNERSINLQSKFVYRISSRKGPRYRNHEKLGYIHTNSRVVERGSHGGEKVSEREREGVAEGLFGFSKQ